MNLFAKASAGLNLTPAQRAWLRFIEGAVVATVIALQPALSAALSSQTPDWAAVAKTALATFAVVILLSLSKWAKAHGDAPLAQLTDDTVAVVQPVSAPVSPSSAPDFPPAAPSVAALGLPDAA